MISKSQMNRQLYAECTGGGIMDEARSVIEGMRPKANFSGYMLPLHKLQQIADAQGVSIEEANDMVIRWSMGTGNPKGLEKLFVPKIESNLDRQYLP